VNIVRRLGEAALLAMLVLGPMMASAADAPVIESIVDRDSGTTLWSTTIPDARPSLKPGQAVLLKGRNFGSGPLTAARPGLDPPAGGIAPATRGRSVRPSPPEAPGKELSKVLFGNVRAFERNLSSYRARIDIGTGLASIWARLRGKTLDYFVEPWEPVPDTWAGDIYGWSDSEIDLTVPITAYAGPIQVIRIPVTGNYVLDIQTGKPLRYPDPNTALRSRRNSSAQIQHCHAHGQAVGYLIENDALISVRHLAVDLDSAIDRARMHDQTIGLQ